MQRLLLTASVGVLVGGYFWPQLYSSFKQSTAIATVVYSKGSTQWISRQNLKTLRPIKQQSIKMNDSLATGSDGEMVLHFKKGAEIKLLPSSFVTLVRKANSTLLSLRRGEIEILREGESDSVLVSQDGQDVPLQQYAPSNNQAEMWIDPQALDTVKIVESQKSELSTTEGMATEITGAPISLAKTPLAPVSNQEQKQFQDQIRAMIADRVGRQKNHLFRCYTSLIQKKKNSHGKLDLHFTVNNLGKVEDPLIVKSEIEDPKFQACLIQIIKRTDFQSFQGQKVSTFLPLRFEKNLNPIE